MLKNTQGNHPILGSRMLEGSHFFWFSFAAARCCYLSRILQKLISHRHGRTGSFAISAAGLRSAMALRGSLGSRFVTPAPSHAVRRRRGSRSYIAAAVAAFPAHNQPALISATMATFPRTWHLSVLADLEYCRPPGRSSRTPPKEHPRSYSNLT